MQITYSNFIAAWLPHCDRTAHFGSAEDGGRQRLNTGPSLATRKRMFRSGNSWYPLPKKRLAMHVAAQTSLFPRVDFAAHKHLSSLRR
jgi:hypothetical protein